MSAVGTAADTASVVKLKSVGRGYRTAAGCGQCGRDEKCRREMQDRTAAGCGQCGKSVGMGYRTGQLPDTASLVKFKSVIIRYT